MEKKIPVECYTRTVGYFASTKNMNPSKLNEVADRKLMSKETIARRLNEK